MKGVIPETTRLRDRHDQADLVERIAGQAARDEVELAPLSRTTLARIAAQIDVRRDRRRRLLPLGWALVFGAFLLGIVTAASAAHMDLLPSWLTRIVAGAATRSSDQTPPPASRRRAAAQKQAPASPPATDKKLQAPPALQEAPGSAFVPTPSHPTSEPSPRKPQRMAMLGGGAAVPSASPTPRPALLPAAPANWAAAGRPAAERPEPVVPLPSPPAGSPAEQGPSALSHETVPDSTPGSGLPAQRPSASPRSTAADPPAAGPSMPASAAPASRLPQAASLLKEIVRALRIEHAPRRALALLDQHGGELAGQAFADESLLLRVEAMLALGDRAAVLRLLDRTSLADLSLSSTLLLTRGELRAEANRCAEGIGDFDLALAQSRRPPKPALLGRARCKQRLGDLTGAQADFDRYRREFPGDPPR